MRKRMVALLLAIVMALALAACGSSSSVSNDSDTNRSVKAVFCSAMNNESQAFAYKMFQAHMAEYGMQVDVLDDQGDAAKQADNVAQAVSQGYQWIIVNPADAAGIVTSLKSAKEANPNVLLSTFSADVPDNSEQYRDFFVGINDTDAGQAAANAFIEKFPNGCKIVEVGGQAGHNAQILRHDGFMEVMKDHPEFEILDVQNTEHWATDEAQSIMEDFITTYGSEIQAVFCHWDNGATGCITALQARSMNDIPIIAVDGCKAGFDQVSDGTQYATIMNSFERDCLDSMALAQKVLAGESVPSDNYIQMDIVTQANINDFTTPEW